jgi:hypothetical protein
VLSGTVFAVSGVLGQAQAGYLDFEPITPAIFLPGETFQQGHYTFTLGTEVGQVDTTAGFVGTTPPSGNSTQFFSAFNDGTVTLTDTFGVGFNLYGFDAGFIGPIPVDEGVSAGRIIVDAITLEGGQVITHQLRPRPERRRWRLRLPELRQPGRLHQPRVGHLLRLPLRRARRLRPPGRQPRAVLARQPECHCRARAFDVCPDGRRPGGPGGVSPP